MLIISYFLTFVLVFSLIFILLPYFKSFIRPREQYKPLGSNREEFSEEFFPNKVSQEDAPIDYKWKGTLNKRSSDIELPCTYADERLVLLIKNPHCLYAYWEISHPWGEDTPVLRIYEVSSSDQGDEFSYLFDLEILREAENWFINVPKDNCSYFVELGQRSSDGRFVAILHSLIIKTPRSSLSTMIDENWIPCDVYGRLENVSYGLSSSYLRKEQERMDN